MFFFDINGRIFQIADSVTENLSSNIHSSLIDFDISCLTLAFFICCHREDTLIEKTNKRFKDLIHGKVMTLEGNHYLYPTKAKEIIKSFTEFMNEVK